METDRTLSLCLVLETDGKGSDPRPLVQCAETPQIWALCTLVDSVEVLTIFWAPMYVTFYC